MKSHESLDLVVIIVAACGETLVHKYRKEQPKDEDRKTDPKVVI